MPLIKSGTKEAIGTNIREMQNAEHPHAQAVAAALSTARRYGKKYAAGGKVDRSHDIPYIAGISKNNRCLYVDRRLPKTLTVKGKTFDPAKYLRVHETHEHMLMTKQGMSYEKAHQSATEKEKAAVKTDGIDWDGYEAEMRGYANETEHEKHAKKPKNLYLGPYKRADGGEVPSQVSEEDYYKSQHPDQFKEPRPREGGLMQTIPQGWEAMQTPEGRSQLGEAARMWWKGQEPGEPVDNSDVIGNIAKNPLVKPIVEMVKGPHDAMAGQMTPEQQADWGAGTALGLIGAGSMRAIGQPAGEIGIFGGKGPKKKAVEEPEVIDESKRTFLKGAAAAAASSAVPKSITPALLKALNVEAPVAAAPAYAHITMEQAIGMLAKKMGPRFTPENAVRALVSPEHGDWLGQNIATGEASLVPGSPFVNGFVKNIQSIDKAVVDRALGMVQNETLAQIGPPANWLSLWNSYKNGLGVEGAAATAAKQKPKAAAVAKQNNLYDIQPEQLKDWKQESGPLGSNPGGLYRDPEGQQWYIKTPQTHDHALNEKLASELYKLAGVPIAEVNLTKLNGKPAVASKIIEGETLANHPEPWDINHLGEHFPADAWLANYDAIGLEKDNILVTQNEGYSKAHRIDMGGALRYRAQGKPKADWGPEVKELQSMRDPNINANGAEIFGQKAKPFETATAKRIAEIPGEQIAQLVEKYGPNSKEAKTKLVADLVARQQQIAKEYGIGQEPTGGVPPTEGGQGIATAQAKEAANYLLSHYTTAKAMAYELHKIANENGPHVAESIFRELPDDVKQQVDANIRKLTQEKSGSTADELEQLINSQHDDMPPEPPPYGYPSEEGFGNTRAEVTKNFAEFAKPLKWEDYVPPKKQVLEPLSTSLPPEELKKLGFNPDVPLFKGGFKLDPGHELPDPTHVKPNEQANFVSDHPGIASWYGDVQHYVARATKAMEVNWPEVAGIYEYQGVIMDQIIKEARARGQDLLVIHGIDDVGGRNQTQYAFLNPAGLRDPKAKFDPDKLHLRLPHAGLVGGGLFGYGMLKGQQEDDVEPKKKAGGGGISKDHWIMHQASRNLQREGTIKSPIPGRTDKIPMSVKAGSYIIPADVPSALGQGNSVAGGHILTSMFNSGPYGMNTMRGHGGARQPRLNMRPQSAKIPNYGMAEGGEAKGEEHVKIIAAGYEHVIPPEIVRDIGHGSIKAGHSVLDKFVLKVRKEHISQLKALKPPKK